MAFNNLSQIIYEKVNEEYGWGKYGAFKVLIRRKDGYINATKLCKDGGKRLIDWNANKESSLLIREVEKVYQDSGIAIIIDQLTTGPNDLRGTYAHPKLIPHIASWVSPTFAIMVSEIVNSYIVREYQEELRKKKGEISNLEKLLYESKQNQEDLKKQLQESKQNQEYMKKQLDLANENIIEAVRGVGQANQNIRGVQSTLDKTAKHSVPPEHLHRKDKETYALYYCERDEKDQACYTQCRARPFHLKQREKQLRKKYEQFRIVTTIHPVPNARSLASEFERRIQERGAVFNLKYQSIALPQGGPLTEEEMVSIAHEVFEEREDPAAEAKEEYVPVNVEIDPEGKIYVEESKEIEPEVVEEKEPTYDERFAELFKNSLTALKELARTFPKDIKTYGGWSGKNKTELVHWILRRQGYTN